MPAIIRPALRLASLAALCAGLGACGAFDRLNNIGKPPELSAIQNPVTEPGYKPVSMPMPTPVVTAPEGNSLWRRGSRACSRGSYRSMSFS